MDDKTLINLYTEKSIAGLKQEHFEKLWEPGDHMYRGEFVSPRRPEMYFASDAEVDAYREALARMDGTIDAPAYAPPIVPTPTAPAQEYARPDRNPIVEALSNATQSDSAGYRFTDDDDEHARSYSKRDYDHDDDDDDDDRKGHYDRDDDDDDD